MSVLLPYRKSFCTIHSALLKEVYDLTLTCTTCGIDTNSIKYSVAPDSFLPAGGLKVKGDLASETNLGAKFFFLSLLVCSSIDG